MHKRCPRPGRPVLNPCAKEFEQAPTTDTDAVEITIVGKDVANKEGEWKEAFDKNGRKYYYNSITRETTWQNPNTTNKEVQLLLLLLCYYNNLCTLLLG